MKFLSASLLAGLALGCGLLLAGGCLWRILPPTPQMESMP